MRLVLLSRKVIHKYVNSFCLVTFVVDELEMRVLVYALDLDAHRLVVRRILRVEPSIHVFFAVQFTNMSASRLFPSVRALIYLLTSPTPTKATVSLPVNNWILVDVFNSLIGLNFGDLVVAYLLLFFEDFRLVLFLDVLLLFSELCLFVLVQLQVRLS